MGAFPLPAWAVMIVAAVTDVLRRLGVNIPIEGNQLRLSTRMMFYNCQKAWRELGEPQVPIHQSLRDTYAWYKAHGEL
jgi:nucleoside-diphosphate-sugar epimerase